MTAELSQDQDLAKVFHDLAGDLNILGCFISLVIKDPSRIQIHTAKAVKSRLDETIEVFRGLQKDFRKKKLKFGSLKKIFSAGVLIDPVKQIELFTAPKSDLMETTVFNYIEYNRPLVVDQSQFKSILKTLYDNAFDAQKGNVSKHFDIILSSYKKFICIKFKDYGCGISQEQIPKVFDESFSTKQHGSGYGLFYIRNLLLSLGGEIKVISKKGFGSSFTIKIPILE
ncbi:MAG: HAMP domain-containing histidine kinase [Candidatus Cloacimonetes bacterium]|nr:HAMP domain-containing histidine kinase [Candidatus Cloacimonadota bacterium]